MNTSVLCSKAMHVSPFFARQGYYRFTFAESTTSSLQIHIDHYADDDRLLISTRLQGTLRPLTRANLWGAALRIPWVSVKTIVLIHWQALKIWAKRIPYIPKPSPLPQALTTSTISPPSSLKSQSKRHC